MSKQNINSSIPSILKDVEKKHNGIAIISKKAVFSNITEQDKIINEIESSGYTHYESINIGGNEILLRFRKK